MTWFLLVLTLKAYLGLAGPVNIAPGPSYAVVECNTDGDCCDKNPALCAEDFKR